MKLNEIYIRDPYILPYDGKYYLYGKTARTNTEFSVYISENLNEWTEPKKVFTPDKDFWADREFWAPEVYFYNDKFYMFASFKSENKCRGTQVLVSNKPDGKFVPLTKEPATPRDWECLDGTLYVDKKGNPHMVFCHEWLQIGDGTVCEIQLSNDLKKAVSKPRLLWKASDNEYVVNILKDRESKITDGPFFYRTKKGKLICIWSSFDKNGYMVLTSASDNGDIDGNWTVDSEPLSAQHGGHGMIFETFEGEQKFVMHHPNEPLHECERAIIFDVIEHDGSIRLIDKNISFTK